MHGRFAHGLLDYMQNVIGQGLAQALPSRGGAALARGHH